MHMWRSPWFRKMRSSYNKESGASLKDCLIKSSLEFLERSPIFKHGCLGFLEPFFPFPRKFGSTLQRWGKVWRTESISPWAGADWKLLMWPWPAGTSWGSSDINVQSVCRMQTVKSRDTLMILFVARALLNCCNVNLKTKHAISFSCSQCGPWLWTSVYKSCVHFRIQRASVCKVHGHCVLSPYSKLSDPLRKTALNPWHMLNPHIIHGTFLLSSGIQAVH